MIFPLAKARRRRLKSRRSLLELADLNRRPRPDNEAMIRAMCMNAYLGDGSSLCRVLGRYKMFVDTGDRGLSSHLLLDGFWEMWVTEFLAEIVKPGMIAIDVGANLGYFTVLLADLVGETGHVHAFEPNPPIARRLRQSSDVNGFYHNVTVHTQALADQDGAEFGLVIPDGEPKNAHMMPVDAADGGWVPVTARRLDGYAELLDADVIKIDAEGAEEAIWRGMAGLFRRDRPLTVVLEFAAARYGDAGAFLDAIVALGFQLELITFEEGVVPRTRAQILAAPPGEDQMLVLRR